MTSDTDGDELATPTAEYDSPNGSVTEQPEPPSSVYPDRTIGGRFIKGNPGGPGHPRKGESVPEKLKKRVERDSDKVVEAVMKRLLRGDAVGNRAFADVRDTIYGVPKQTLVVEREETAGDRLTRNVYAQLAKLTGQTVDAEDVRVLDEGETEGDITDA